MILTPERLCECAEAAFGPYWRSVLGRELGVTGRTIWRYEHGAPLPPDKRAKLCAALRRKKVILARFETELCGGMCGI